MIEEKYINPTTLVQSFDWVDYTSGVGYKTYYCAVGKDSTGVVRFLTSKELDSGCTTDLGSGSYYTDFTNGSDIDIDFDITFGVPAIVGGGDAFINLTLDWRDNSAGHFHVTIYHVAAVGGAETSLGTKQSEVFVDQNANYYFRFCFKIPLTAKKFAIGDKLRITFDTDLTGGAGTNKVYHDPSSSITLTDVASRTIGTDFTCYIPFKINQ